MCACAHPWLAPWAALFRRFAAAARLSEANLALYRTLLQPTVRALSNPTTAEWMSRVHPLRLSYEMFSDANPWMRMVAGMADNIRPTAYGAKYTAAPTIGCHATQAPSRSLQLRDAAT